MSIMVDTMPARVQLESPLQRELLAQLGARLKQARLAQGYNVSDMARRLSVSRTTVYAVEAGDPNVTLGTYVQTLTALGMATDLVMLGTGLSNASPQPVPSESRHAGQDRRSLALHEEAVRRLQLKPELVQRALQVLDHWDQVADPHSKPLRDEWRDILLTQRWDLAVARTERGNQLRQSSPLGFVLEPAVRNALLKRGDREPTAA